MTKKQKTTKMILKIMRMMTKMTMSENSRGHIAGTGGMRLEYTRELSTPKRRI
jgi:hypothetical protein